MFNCGTNKHKLIHSLELAQLLIVITMYNKKIFVLSLSIRLYSRVLSHSSFSLLPPSQSMSTQCQVLLSAVLFSTMLWLLLIFTMRLCLKQLLSYHRWMFEPHGKMSTTTKVWVVSVVVFIFYVQPFSSKHSGTGTSFHCLAEYMKA